MGAIGWVDGAGGFVRGGAVVVVASIRDMVRLRAGVYAVVSISVVSWRQVLDVSRELWWVVGDWINAAEW